MYSVRLRRLAYPILRMAGRARYVQIAKDLQELQWQPRSALIERATDKARAIVKHAYEHVPLYRERYQTQGLTSAVLTDLDDLQRFPIVEREDIREHYPDGLVADNIARDRLQPDQTSGSSGSPLRFFVDRASLPMRAASRALLHSWAGLELGERWIRIAATSATPHPRRVVERVQHRFVDNQNLVDVMKVRIDSEETVRAMARWQPSHLWGFASYIVSLAQFLQRIDLRWTPSLKAVITTSETLSLQGRATIEEAFSCPVFNRYGSRELGNCAQDCAAGRGMHFNSEVVFFEVVDDEGQWVEPGEVGRLVATDLLNYAAPFVRYYTGDLAVAGTECDCGRGWPVLDGIEGRESEAISCPDGKVVSPTTLGHHLFVLHGNAKAFSAYQLVKLSPGAARLLVVPVPGLDSEALLGARRQMECDITELLAGVDVEVAIVDEIPQAPSGKRAIIRDAATGEE